MEDNKNVNSITNDKNEHTVEKLKELQGLPLTRKIGITQTRLIEWYVRNDKKCYVSFSGGKDSTVLAYIASQVCSMLDCKLVLWFSDTGLEFPELREHVKTYGKWLMDEFDGLEVETIMEYPTDRNGKRITFKEVIQKWGYPIISKDISKVIYDARGAIAKGNENTSYACNQLNGTYINKNTGELSERYNCKKWKFLLDSNFKISNRCCNVMKKQPAHRFDKKSGLKPIIATMASESRQRKTKWLQHGCNAFSKNNPSSQPMSFWLENDVLEFIVEYGIPYPSVYGEIRKDDKGNYYTTGYNRTGCMFCGYGCHLEKEPNRFQMLKKTHPKVWEFCMKPWDDGGLGMKEVLEYIHVDIE